MSSAVLPTEPARAATAWSSAALRYYLALPAVWAYQFFHNTHGILRVLDITRFRPLPAGLIGPEHPWATGINPSTGRPVWHENVLFRSPRPADPQLAEDDDVVTQVGEFLARLTALSAVVPEIPWGPRRRMPHGINYIHGTCHYNSGILIFTDFPDAINHFSDPRFNAEVRRFVREERREVLILFRCRFYSTRDFAYFSCFMRTIFPWFCNANGPQKRVLWGNPSPFPAANIITGNWIRDIYLLKEPGGAAKVVRVPIASGRYLTAGPYRGWRCAPTWPEKLLARYTHWRIRMRGSRGGMFFVDRRRLLADKLEDLERQGIPDQPIASL
jgi:hypothetical protein